MKIWIFRNNSKVISDDMLNIYFLGTKLLVPSAHATFLSHFDWQFHPSSFFPVDGKTEQDQLHFSLPWHQWISSHLWIATELFAVSCRKLYLSIWTPLDWSIPWKLVTLSNIPLPKAYIILLDICPYRSHWAPRLIELDRKLSNFFFFKLKISASTPVPQDTFTGCTAHLS